jgi:hypothetical protein
MSHKKLAEAILQDWERSKLSDEMKLRGVVAAMAGWFKDESPELAVALRKVYNDGLEA